MPLSPVQQQLLIDLVEAERRIPQDQRTHFLVLDTEGPPGVQLCHDGWLQRDRRVFEGDIDSLARAGLISMSRVSGRHEGFYVTEPGFSYCGKLAMGRTEPVRRAEAIPMEYIKSTEFQRKYPIAYAKWSQAEAMLWPSHSEQSLTTIGHLIREAMQEFATALASRVAPSALDPDPARTVTRLRASLTVVASRLGATEKPFLDALLAYWGTVSDLVQRQEHGAQREQGSLRWRDARRIVLQAAIVMFEIDESVSLVGN